MVDDTSDNYQLNRFQTWLVTGDPQKRLLVLTLVVFGVSVPIGAAVGLSVAHQHGVMHRHVSGTAIAVILGLPIILFGLVFVWVYYKKPFKAITADRDTYLGVTLDDQDKIALYKWQKFGLVPQSQKLRPVLGKYLDYSEQLATGERVILSGTIKVTRIFLLVGVMLQIAGYVMRSLGQRHLYVTELPGLLFNFACATLFLVFTSRNPRLKPFRRSLASRQLRKIARMRRQLQ